MIMLSATDARRWGADCTEHALFLYDARHPQDETLRAALQTYRDNIAGIVDDSTWQQLWLKLREKQYWYTAHMRSDVRIDQAAYLVFSSLLEDQPIGMSKMAEAAISTMNGRNGDEFIWQWYRLLDYLQGTV